MTECLTCSRLARRDAGETPLWDSIYRALYWDLVHSYDTSLLGWLVLIARRHIEAVAEMSDEESIELGRLQRRVSMALHEVIGCKKTYIVQFAEAAEHPHVHFHVIPRMPDLSDEARGPGVFRYLGVSDEERVAEESMNAIAAQVGALLDSAT